MPFYFSYAVGLIIPIVLGAVLYVRTGILAERDIDARVRFTLDQVAVDIASILGEVDYVVAQASSSEPIIELAGITFKTDYERQQGLIHLLFNPTFVRTTSFSRFITDFYLILPTPGVVLSNRGSMSIKSFYRYVFTLPNVDEHEFLASYTVPDYIYEFRKEQAILGLGTQKKDVLVLLHSLSRTNKPSNILLFVLDQRAIQAELEAAAFEEGAAVFATDHRGTLIGTVFKQTPRFTVIPDKTVQQSKISGWQIIGSYTEYAIASPDGSIRLLAKISRDVFSSRVSFIRRSTLIFVLLLIIIDILIILIFSTRNARPLSRMLRVLQNEYPFHKKDIEGRMHSQPSGRDRLGSLSFVENQLVHILEQKHDLEGELDRQRPVLNSLILQSLIQGIRIRDEELKELLIRSGINLDSVYRCCFILSFNPLLERVASDIYEEFIIKKLILEELLHKEIFGNSSFLYQSYERLVVIHGADARSPEAYGKRLTTELRKTLPVLRQAAGLPIIAGVGNPCTVLTHIQRSFEEAAIALEQYAPLSPGGFAVYRDFTDSSESYYYPMELELKLMNATRQGSDEVVREVLGIIRRVNFEERHLTRESILMLLGELQGTVAKLNVSIETATGKVRHVASPSIPIDLGSENWELLLEQIEENLLSLGEAFREHSSVNRSALNDKAIEQYLQEAFRDVNLSLTSIAEKFGVSEKYFSRYFKERFHINFHVYIERMRLNSIRSRMLSTDLPLRDLINDSGYCSTVTFSRAFKRAFGMNPSVYRERALKRGT